MVDEPYEMRMLPGQPEYTEREKAALRALITAACEAEEMYSLEELERWARANKLPDND